jgi:hypothetical protein
MFDSVTYNSRFIVNEIIVCNDSIHYGIYLMNDLCLSYLLILYLVVM